MFANIIEEAEQPERRGCGFMALHLAQLIRCDPNNADAEGARPCALEYRSPSGSDNECSPQRTGPNH